MNQKYKFALAFLAVGLLLGSFITYSFSQGSSTFTLTSGIYPGAPSYTIWVESGTYYAKNQYGSLAYSGTNATTVITSTLASDSIILIEPGTYYINAIYGIQVWGFHNLEILGYGATLINSYTGSQGELFYVHSDNVTVVGLTLDQDREDPLHTYNGVGGTQWILKTVGENIAFRDLHIINGIGCGYVSSDSQHVSFENCVFDNFGEHPIYTGLGDANIQFWNCRFYNWGENIRGYNKITYCQDTKFFSCVFEINRDGHIPSAEGGGASYIAVIYDANNTLFRDCIFYKNNATMWIESGWNTQIIGGNWTYTDCADAIDAEFILDSGNYTLISGVSFFYEEWYCVYGEAASDETIENCFVSGGNAGGAFRWGFRTRVTGCTWGDDVSTGANGMADTTASDDGLFLLNDVNNSTLTFSFPAAGVDIDHNIYH